MLLLFFQQLYAAVGCTLNDPDRDVKRIFPQSTGYRTEFITIQEAGGQELYKKIEKELGDKFDPVYEAIDVPYAFYDVLKGKEVIATIHGVNQKGEYGGMQLILATDLNGKILDFFYQKMSSPEAGRFMNKNFTSQFIGLGLNDFLKGNFGIKDPSSNSSEDFQATLRGLKKNLILLDELKLKKAARR
ncbi:MAG: hypothetical protein PHF11_05675 [Candidatus Omnitrophica bacterium]|nr:hypothetical protein [Candidatus Omnitrophota bacterium]